jgi:folylpolyglutamate synthase
VRERIRIDNAPLSTALFTRYFFDVWDALGLSADEQSGVLTDRPPYFRFLTLMSFHVFLSEGVDAAVYEVGVGGEYDATNVIAQPAAVGISTLGIDHVTTLGHTIEEIAWHKAGILKTGSPAFSTEQVPAAMEVVRSRAAEKDVQLQVVGVDSRLQDVQIKPDADFQRRNASLAIALAEAVMTKLDPTFEMSPDKLPREFVEGLEQVVWRGRCETKVEGNVRWFLDGAHTADSLKVAAQWFGLESALHPGKRVLIFNQQGREEAVSLLEILYQGIKEQGLVRFDHVVFCTNITYAEKGYKKDMLNVGYDPEAIKGMTMQKLFMEKWTELDPEAKVSLSPSIEGALEYVKTLAGQEKEVQALITGSLHLVGGALGLLDGADAL